MPRGRGDEGRGLSAREAKNLSYTSEVPSFLQNLHAQVHGSRHNAARARHHDEDDEDPVMAFLGANSENQTKRPSSEAAPRGDGYDSDNDLEHAQVVVLKEGKHLSKEEYMDQRTQTDEAPPGRLSWLISATGQVAEAGAPPKPPKQTAGPPRPKSMTHAKDLIRAHQNQKAESQASAPDKKRRKKAKTGVGLSFDVDDA